MGESGTHETIEVSIVMPCLNEVRTLGACIVGAFEAFERLGIVGEGIVADNGSTDGSREMAERLGARVVPVAERGYGAALAGGIAAARGRFVVMGDSDESYDFGNLMPFVDRLREGYDLVMGNRFRGGIEPGAMPPLHRYFGNPLLTAIGRAFFRSPCGDFYCGHRAFRKEVIRGLDLQSTGMEFALEMLVKATMTGCRIAEVPVKLKPDGRDRAPHLRSWLDGWRSLRLYLIYSPRWLFLYPGVMLMGLGLALGGRLLFGPWQIGHVSLDVHTMIYCAAAVVIGFQLVMFSAFGKLMAIATGLHPRNARLERLLARAGLERGIAAGAGMLAIGLATSGYAFSSWAGVGFGDLDPFRVMRLAIPAAMMLMLGAQIISSSFYLSLLRFQMRKAGLLDLAKKAPGPSSRAGSRDATRSSVRSSPANVDREAASLQGDVHE